MKVTPGQNGGSASGEMHYYNSFDQLTRRMVLTTYSANTLYTYNAQGIRTAKKTPDGLRTAFLLDGGNVVCEYQSSGALRIYLRGINLICQKIGTAVNYYLFNAHGDVVNLVNTAGVVTQSYDYDAFGVEKDPDPLDTNHFRYCGEYLDAETGRYYLRARYYDPLIGRFTQRDTHWNTANMIYGDNPQKINEREDKLGLKAYSYAPQIMAIMQAGNLYVYGINNPANLVDPSGNIALVDDIALVIGVTALGLAAANILAKATMDMIESMGDTLLKLYQRSKEEAELLKRVISSAIAAAGAPDPNDDDDLKFESKTKSAKKLEREMRERGWTESSVRETVRDPYTTRVSINKANGHPATAYYTKDGAYVVVDDITNEVLQVSDRFLPMEWIPDSSIINPYIPFP